MPYPIFLFQSDTTPTETGQMVQLIFKLGIKEILMTCQF